MPQDLIIRVGLPTRIVWGGSSVILLVGFLIGLSVAKMWWALPLPVVFVLAVLRYQVMPTVIAGRSGLVIRNPFRTHRITWSQLSDIRVRRGAYDGFLGVIFFGKSVQITVRPGRKICLFATLRYWPWDFLPFEFEKRLREWLDWSRSAGALT